MSQRHTAVKKRPEKKAAKKGVDGFGSNCDQPSDDGWVSDHDLDGYVTPDEDIESKKRDGNAARMRQKRSQRTPKSAALDRAGNAAQKKRARNQLTPTSAALDRAGNAAQMKQARNQLTPTSAALDRGSNAGRKKKARNQLTPKSAVAERADDAARKRQARSSVALNLEDEFETSQWMNSRVFSDAERARLEAEFDHEPNAAIAWMAASSPASFGYRSCSMDDQLEAVLGEDGSKVLPPGNRERTVEAMKLAMDGRQIRACAACGFRGYQTGRDVNVHRDLQHLEMDDVALQQFEASSSIIQNQLAA
jgi:hypothetical protein